MEVGTALATVEAAAARPVASAAFAIDDLADSAVDTPPTDERGAGESNCGEGDE